ncbi:hypothetical protein PIB30_082969, partial [Stylosanthes scabra]|nr:hypothetical protein [Stylosanthes scabra]
VDSIPHSCGALSHWVRLLAAITSRRGGSIPLFHHAAQTGSFLFFLTLQIVESELELVAMVGGEIEKQQKQWKEKKLLQIKREILE